MHRLKTIYELRITIRLHKEDTEPKDPSTLKRNYTPNPERLSDNGTLDTCTFLHRVRPEMLNTHQYKQNKHDNLTRKREICTQRFNKQSTHSNQQGSTIVVKDRNEYISNAMLHLNGPNVYKPLHKDISPTLKEVIIDQLKAPRNNGFFLHKHGLNFANHLNNHAHLDCIF